MTSPVCLRFACDVVFVIEMGITCSCNKAARFKDAAGPCLASFETKTRWRKERQQNEQNSPKAKPPEGDFRKAVRDSVDVDPIEIGRASCRERV